MSTGALPAEVLVAPPRSPIPLPSRTLIVESPFEVSRSGTMSSDRSAKNSPDGVRPTLKTSEGRKPTPDARLRITWPIVLSVTQMSSSMSSSMS